MLQLLRDLTKKITRELNFGCMVHCDIIVSLLFSCRDLDQNVEIHMA